VASGVDVVLATGRSPWSGVADLAGRLGLTGPQITMQGALISDPATGEVHRLRALPPAIYRDVLAFADELGLDPVVALIDGHRAERLPDGGEPFTVPLVDGDTFRYVNGLERLTAERPVRVFLPTGPERHRAVRRAAAARFADRASVVWSDTAGVEILARGTHKGDAVTWLAASRGIGLDEVAAVGDAANDIEMLWCAGRSAAIGSAPLEVRVCADIVVGASADRGLLDAFAWFFPDLADVFADVAGRGLASVPSGRPAG
jgi:hydroxymethylpyrimidine pyrophosphatase-like HAD family hydrolase